MAVYDVSASFEHLNFLHQVTVNSYATSAMQ